MNAQFIYEHFICIGNKISSLNPVDFSRKYLDPMCFQLNCLPVLLRRGLVVDGEELHGLRLLGLEVDDGVGAVPLAGVEDEVAVKVPGWQLNRKSFILSFGLKSKSFEF